LRLLFVNSAWAESWGGGEKWTVEAAQWFRAKGHESCVVGRPGSRLLAAAEAKGLRTVSNAFGGDLAPTAILKARQIIRDSGANLVVVNFNKEAWLFGIAAKVREVPVVARHGFPLLRKGMYHRFLMTCLIDKLIVNAAAIKEWYRALDLPVDDIEVIHNGTALETQKTGELRKRFDVQADELLVLGAGRLESQKRFERFLEIAARLAPTRPHVKFLIAGDGPLKDELNARIRELHLEEQVRLTGFLPDFAEVAGDADLFLLTSDNEGTPNVLLEAMAAGVACVSFGIGSVREILAGDLAENVIQEGDTDAMGARAARLLDHTELRTQTAMRAQRRIEEEFGMDVSMERFERVFQQVVSGR
jgi:glycosyltransferase involved in cell wall biosynthesis